jgi:hypothetical protein
MQQLAQSFARCGQVSARSPMALKLLGPFRLWLWCKTLFRHLPNRMFTHTGGDRGKAECGASAEGWRERPALALFLFSLGTTSLRRCCCNDSGPPSSPPAPRGPLSEPRESGAFVFLASSPRFFVLTVTFGIPGARYQKCSRPVLAGIPIPRPPRSPGPEALG